MAGAASRTIGAIAIHDTSHETIQFHKKMSGRDGRKARDSRRDQGRQPRLDDAENEVTIARRMANIRTSIRRMTGTCYRFPYPLQRGQAEINYAHS
jgi:hypothetical protein